MEFYRQQPPESNNLLQQLAQLSDEQLQRDYLNYLQWTQPIAQMLAQLEDEAQALRVIRLYQFEKRMRQMVGARHCPYVST